MQKFNSTSSDSVKIKNNSQLYVSAYATDKQEFIKMLKTTWSKKDFSHKTTIAFQKRLMKIKRTRFQLSTRNLAVYNGVKISQMKQLGLSVSSYNFAPLS